MSRVDTREYDRGSSIVFRRTAEKYGGLSNMAPRFPLEVNGIRIRTSEALYQACRFPQLPDVQRLIIDQSSPMAAKMRSKPFRDRSRPDWDAVRVKVMRWCLRVKLAQNWDTFGSLLKATGQQPIVEESKKDDYWGAHPLEDRVLVGANVLGRLLMELRQELMGPHAELLRYLAPLSIPDFLLYGEPIRSISAHGREVTRPDPHRNLPIEIVDADILPWSTSSTGGQEQECEGARRTGALYPETNPTRHLNSDEFARLQGYGVTISATSLQFANDLGDTGLRTVCQALSAIRRRRPNSEDWVNWLIGDWAIEADKRLGGGSAERITREEEEAYLYTQDLLRLSGAALVALQWTELAIGSCVRLLEPEHANVTPEDLLSPEAVKRRRTIGQFNRLLKDRKVFLDDFEQRMDRFVADRNRFAHQLWTERLPGDPIDYGARMKTLNQLESFVLKLLREAYEIGRVFKGLFAAIGVTIAERENVKNFDHWLDAWKEDLGSFLDVQRKA